MLNDILFTIPNFEKIQVAPVLQNQKTLGWNSTVVTTNGPCGSGTHENKNVAMRIAIAESLERALFRNLLMNSSKGLYLTAFPTTSGFACGFENKLTGFRSFCEGIERWIWSKWIDDKIGIQKVSIDLNQLTKLDLFFLNQFDSYNSYRLTLKIDHNIYGLKSLEFGVFLGFKDNGVFPGSRVTSIEDFKWSHALVESWRHLKISKKPLNDNQNFVVSKRIKFFGENKEIALSQIPISKSNWPDPEILIHKQIPTNLDRVYLWRTLCKDFKGWHLGDEKRFIY